MTGPTGATAAGDGEVRASTLGPVLHGDRGQVGLGLGVVLVVAAAVAMLVVGDLGRQVVDRTRARTAADAAALAGVVGGAPAAGRLAADNGGDLESFVADGEEVEVSVRVGRARAVSRAGPAPDEADSRLAWPAAGR